MMRFTTRTEYGLMCLIYMAHQQDRRPVTTKEIVADERFSLTFTEKILQKLRSTELIQSVHGQQGGYVLARHASLITLRDIVEALEGHTFDVFCEPKLRKLIVCNHFHLCGVKPIWLKTKEMLDHYYGSITLEMLAKQEFSGLATPAKEAV